MCFLIILSKTFSFVLEKEIFSISILSYVLKEKTWFLQSFLFHVSISSMFFFVFMMFVRYSLFQANTISQVSSDTWMKALYKRQAYQVLDLGIL